MHGQWDWMRGSRHPLDCLGVGQRMSLLAVEAHPQPCAPPVDQRPRHGRRHRLSECSVSTRPTWTPGALGKPLAFASGSRRIFESRHRCTRHPTSRGLDRRGRDGPGSGADPSSDETLAKIRRQAARTSLPGRRCLDSVRPGSVLSSRPAPLVANIVRNVWASRSSSVATSPRVCSSREAGGSDGEGDWYRRQVAGLGQLHRRTDHGHVWATSTTRSSTTCSPTSPPTASRDRTGVRSSATATACPTTPGPFAGSSWCVARKIWRLRRPGS